LKTRYHDLQVEHKEMGEKLKESRADRSRCLVENERLRKKVRELEVENAELRRRLLDAEKYKDLLRDAKYAIGKLEYKVEKLQDQLEQVKDKLAQCKLDLLNANSYQVKSNSLGPKIT
jgi:chromosome segregation ATPase